MEHQNQRIEKRPRIRSAVKTQAVFSTDRVKGRDFDKKKNPAR
ncbi:MAG TPA: hypothetical protein VFE50_08465 [Cyclobacteriaceae bacterium]|nr:hypothetical protein [Cyclobacteriaceae bacterium]